MKTVLLWGDYPGAKALAEALKINSCLTTLHISSLDSYYLSAFKDIASGIDKNRILKIEKEKDAAKAGLELLSTVQGGDSLVYTRDAMDQIVDQMINLGLHDEIIELGKLIKPKT